MNLSTSPSPQALLRQAASLLVYQALLESEPVQTFLVLLQTICESEQSATSSNDSLRAYGRWFNSLAKTQQSWQGCLLKQILRDENPFTLLVQQQGQERVPPALQAAARSDLQVLQNLYECSGEQLSQWVQTIAHLPAPPVVWDIPDSQELDQLKSVLKNYKNWAEGLEVFTTYYQKEGIGLFAEYRAFRWQAGQFAGIAYPDPVKVTDLVGYETQKETLLKNTEFLLKGYPALNVLLYGSRGSGKSSLVKGLLYQYEDEPLRLVEVSKSDLKDLPAIAQRLRAQPQKFIIFVDDLSFEEDEDAFKALKVVLEGGLTARPQNLVVYATSNRRHLIREFFGDRPRPKDGDEVHAWDTMQEKLSFSDRFGLTLTFEPANQDTYLKMVHHLATLAGISIKQEDLEFRALQWATRHNGRSGRSARQFVDFLKAELEVS